MSLIDQEGNPTSHFISLIEDQTALGAYQTLSDYFHAQESSIPELIQRFIEEVEAQLLDQVKYYAYLIYFLKDNRDEWGMLGEDQIKLSFCRQLLDLSPDIGVSVDHMQKFYMQVEQNLLPYRFSSFSIRELQEKLDNLSISFLGNDYDIHHVMEINPILRFLGLDLTLQGGAYGDEKELILGRGDVSSLGDYISIKIEEELFRTPNVIISMAAAIAGKSIFVRSEALHTIFYQKWVDAFLYVLSMQGSYQDPYFLISLGIKRYVYKLYGATSKNELIQCQSQFVKDMSETIFTHECGHGVIQHHMLSLEVACLGEATKVFGDTICTTMLELLAEMAPEKNGLHGPLVNMVNHAKDDEALAQRLFYMYLSDVWFFDTPEAFMYDYSEVMVLFLAQHFQDDGAIDFQTMGERCRLASGSQMDFVKDQVEGFVARFKDVMKTFEFTYNDQQVDLDELYAILEKEQEVYSSDDFFDRYQNTVALWATLFELVKNNQDQHDQVVMFLEKERVLFLSQWFEHICGGSIASQYQYSIRDYLKEAMGRFIDTSS